MGFQIENGVLVKYTEEPSVIEVVIPDGVTSIGDHAFSCSHSLVNITIPESVTTIGEWAFYACDSLTSITIPEGVTSIGEMAFASLGRLKSVTIPKSVTSIGKKAFGDCWRIEWLEVLGSQEIPMNAFLETELKRVFMPNVNPSKIGKRIQKIALVTYCGEALAGNPACEGGKKDYQAFLKRNQKKFCEEPVKNAPIVRYLLENRLLGELVIDDLIDKIPESAEPELRALALSYSNTLASDGMERMEKKMDKEIKTAVKKQKAVQTKAEYEALPLSERAATLFKLSAQEKVELLEEIVLQGTIADVESAFETHKSFEFTARALGYAVRCRETDMVEALLRHGATFRYDSTAAFIKKYGCKIKVSNNYSYKPNYALFVLGESAEEKLYPVLKTCPPASVEERCSNLKLVCAVPEELESLQEVLYFAVLNQEKEIVRVLRENNVASLLPSFHGNKTVCMTEFRSMDAEAGSERGTFVWKLLREDMAWKLTQFLAISDCEMLHFSKPELYFMDAVEPALCREDVFRFVMEGKVDASKVNPRDFVKGLLKAGNLAGLSYALEHKWAADKKAMLKIAAAEGITEECVLAWLKS